MRKIRHRKVCDLSKATQLVSSGARIHPCPLMQDPVFLNFKLYSFPMFLVLLFNTPGKASVAGNGGVGGKAKTAKGL